MPHIHRLIGCVIMCECIVKLYFLKNELLILRRTTVLLHDDVQAHLLVRGQASPFMSSAYLWLESDMHI